MVEPVELGENMEFTMIETGWLSLLPPIIAIALALLPEGTDLGTHLRYEMFSYEIVE